MTIRVGLSGDSTDLVTFGCSAAREAVRSLHVLSNVRRHPLHISWALATRQVLPREVAVELDRHGFWFLDGAVGFGEIWPHDRLADWPDELHMLRTARPGAFAEAMIRRALVGRGPGPRVTLAAFAADPGLQERAAGTVTARHPASLVVLRQLVTDPAGCRDRFADLLQAYWDACLAAGWPRMQARLQDDIARRGRALSRHGPAALAGVSEHVQVDVGQGIVTIRPPGVPREADRLEAAPAGPGGIVLEPSHFVWPEVAAVVHRDGPDRSTVVIVYSVAEFHAEGHVPMAPDQLLRLLRSAGDPTRLQILRLVAHRARSTREIAGLVGLTEAAVSKHLKILQGAGWVTARRQSYYVYYDLVRESVARLSGGLEDLLG